jgi:hypothetical protein
MKTTMKILSLLSFLSFGFADVAHAGEGAARRGHAHVQAAAKAVVAGPAVGFDSCSFSASTWPRLPAFGRPVASSALHC